MDGGGGGAYMWIHTSIKEKVGLSVGGYWWRNVVSSQISVEGIKLEA